MKLLNYSTEFLYKLKNYSELFEMEPELNAGNTEDMVRKHF